MSNLIQKIEEHKKLFPLADLSGQLLKLEEELSEVNAAENLKHKIDEIADCIICSIGIYRFAPQTAHFIIKSIMMQNDEYIPEIYDAVERKWQINLKRKWEYKNGRYHHIEEFN